MSSNFWRDQFSRDSKGFKNHQNPNQFSWAEMISNKMREQESDRNYSQSSTAQTWYKKGIGKEGRNGQNGTFEQLQNRLTKEKFINREISKLDNDNNELSNAEKREIEQRLIAANAVTNSHNADVKKQRDELTKGTFGKDWRGKLKNNIQPLETSYGSRGG